MVDFKKKIAWFILILLIGLFFIKLTSRALVKKVEERPLSFLEKVLIAIDENVVVNPFHVYKALKQINKVSNIGKVPQSSIPEKVTHCIGEDRVPVDKNYLYSYYADSSNRFIIELLDLNKNEVLHSWEIPFKKMEKLYEQWNSGFIGSQFDEYVLFDLGELRKARLRGPLLLENNHLVVKVQGMLICLDKGSNIEWWHKKFFHHSLEINNNGRLWAASYHDTSKNSPFLADQIVKINAKTGKTLLKRNIDDIFRENPKHDLSKVKLNDPDPYHLNDVQPVNSNGYLRREGDLFISLRGINAVFLYRPGSNKILWRKMTGWSKQHDVKILSDSVITIFDNNLERSLDKDRVKDYNRFLSYNVSKDTIKNRFQSVLKGQNIKTPTQGRAKFFQKDALFYVEATDQAFFVIKDIEANETYKCYIPGRSKDKAGNLGWFRLLD